MKNRNIHENWAILDLILHTWKDKEQILETKIEEVQDINQVLREKDKMKEDVITKVNRKIGCGITID